MNVVESLEAGARWLLGIMEPIANFGPTFNDEQVPLFVILLVGTGIFLTLRLGLIQVRRLGHGVGVTTGKYDDPNEPGDVSHFQALSTALSATIGIGNIAGVAMAIHFGGPGALFWMWMTAFLGMATKYAEVVLAQHYRQVDERSDAKKWEGTVSGGPMYYIERGLGPKFKWMAILFAVLLGLTAFLTGNAIQANTLADTIRAQWGVTPAVTGIVSALLVGAVIVGGITRIGRVTGILAPFMAILYVGGALVIIMFHLGDVVPAFGLIFREAFNPTAGVAGTGVGAILVTLIWGVRRGLFSNEAGQGSAPIAHAAAKTDEPVSEGVVALLEPFIDTLIVCTTTGLVIVMTQVWDDKHPTELVMSSGDVAWVADLPDGAINRLASAPGEFRVEAGLPVVDNFGDSRFGWHSVRIDEFFTDAAQTLHFTGVIYPARGVAVGADGTEYTALYGDAVEAGAPLTMLGFQAGMPGDWGGLIVVMGVILFAISTAISWSYYGDRCAHYLFGTRAIMPYRVIFVLMHFVGAVASLDAIWSLGDVFLAIVVFPNLIALLLLSGKVADLTNSYFERRPWEDNERVQAEIRAARRR